MAVYHSTNPLDWYATDGIYVAEQDAPSAPRLVGSNTARIVGEFPWGPRDQIIEIGSPAEYVTKLLGKTAAADLPGFKGHRAVVGKVFGPFEVVIPSGTDEAKESRTIAGSSPEDIFTAEALYPGDHGIEMLFEKVSSDVFNLSFKWGTQVETFTNLDRATTAFDDITPTWVTLTWNDADASEALPASDSGYVALSGGSFGTIADANYTGDASTVVGLRVFESGDAGGFYFAAEYATDAWRSALRAHLALMRAEGAAQAGDASEDFDDAETTADTISDDRLALMGARSKQLIGGTLYEVDDTAFAASVWTQIPPHYSLADADYAYCLAAVVEPEDGMSLSRANWIRAEDAGLVLMEPVPGGGFRFHNNIVSDRTSQTTRRMKDLVSANLALALLPYQSKPALDTYVEGALSALQSTLRVMKGDDTIPQTQFIEQFSVRILSRTGSTVIYDVRVKLWGEMRFIVLNVTVGEDITIEEAAA